MRRRRLSVITTVGVAVTLLLSGCTQAPSSAASVGGVAIPDGAATSRTLAFLSENADPDTPPGPADVARLNRTEVTSLIRHELLVRAAAAQGLRVTEAEVSTALTADAAAASDARAPHADARGAVADYLLLVKLLATRTQGFSVTDVQVRFDLVVETTESAAVAARTRYLTDPAALHADAATASTQDSPQTDVSLSAAKRPDLGPTGVFTAPVGSVLVLQESQTQFAVIGITARATGQQTVPLSAIDPTDAATVLSIGSLALAGTAAAAGVSVNPRFGVWDPATLQVAAPLGGL